MPFWNHQRIHLRQDSALGATDFGQGTAEYDEALWDTFVETDLWVSMLNGRADIVLGAKGSGKSAIYARLFKKGDELRRRGVVLVGAESLVDDPVFNNLPNLPSLTGRQFVGLWKLYFLTLVGDKLRTLQFKDARAIDVITQLEESQLLPKLGTEGLVELFQRVLRYVQFDLEVDVGVKTPALVPLPVQGDAQLKGKITLHEPSPDETQRGKVSIHHLLRSAGEVLERHKLTFWILVDRLDIAFPSVDEDLEAKALRALIQTYIDLRVTAYRLSIKLFLRDDVWERIIQKPGDAIPGANAVIYRTIRWHDQALISLLARRLIANKSICELYHLRANKVRDGYQLQQGLVSRVLPETVDTTQDGRSSIDWVLEALRDGSRHVAPREIVLLLIFAREIQLDRLGLRIAEYIGEELFEPATIIDAIRRVSEFRLFQTLCLEYPHLVMPLNQLRGSQAMLRLSDLTFLWRLTSNDASVVASAVARQLVSLGFFEKHEQEGEDVYEVAPLYRPALAARATRRP